MAETLCNARNVNRIPSTEHAWLNTQALRSRALQGRQTVEEWSVKSTSSAAVIDTIDRTSGSEGVGRRKDEEDAKECDVQCHQ